MGQKSIVITLKKMIKNPNLSLVLDRSPKHLQVSIKLQNTLERLLQRKKIMVIKKTLNINNNQLNMSLTLYFRTSRVDGLKKKLNGTANKLSVEFLTKLIHNNSLNFNPNFILLKLNIINKVLNKSLISLIYLKIKKFERLLFTRRLNVFFDFVKSSSLLCLNKLSVSAYLSILIEIFKVLPKNLHSRFFLFLNVVIYLLVKDKKVKDLSKGSNIDGIRVSISGKLKGKLRKASVRNQVGKIPSQSTERNTTFSKMNAHTRIGVFGFKMWLSNSI